MKKVLCINNEKNMDVVHKTNYYLDVAQQYMKYSNCHCRCYGAVIVRNDTIISTGYSYVINIRDLIDRPLKGFDYIQHQKFISEQDHHYKIIHAEAVALKAVSINETMDAKLYLVGRDLITGKYLEDTKPCIKCLHLIIRAGIAQVVCRTSATAFNVMQLCNK